MSMPISADLLDGVVLAVLKHDDAYGYNLTQQIQDKIPLSPSTLYPVLRRLKAQDWLETYDKPYQAGIAAIIASPKLVAIISLGYWWNGRPTRSKLITF
ncbi:transcriptional regulator, PadR family [Agrilactobacillus composti DSM 18527 = JCM 14202]|nr:transcriptional regulator, PadR family [Agrilactobacillus composti DSM 18527 = JCM 14202]